MTELSPAAQAVLDAFRSSHTGQGCLVAAFRAAVDAVAPEKTIEGINYVHQSYVDGYKDALYEILIITNQIEIQWAEPLTDSDMETLAKAFSVTRIDFGANHGLS